MITPEEFFKGDKIKIDVFKAKYPSAATVGVDECFRNTAREASNVSIEKDKKYWENRWTKEFLDDIWRAGGSIISSTNKPDKKLSVFNCCTLPLEDDTLESIYKTRTNTAKCAAYRQGIGVDFSALRPRGSNINNSAEESEGAVHWIKSFGNISKEVGQKGRQPALLSSLKIHHPDIEEFISCKNNIKELEAMNNSVQITDDFMKSYFNNEEWELFFNLKSGNKISKKINSTKLFDKICEQSHKTGEPGIQFIDLMKDYSIQEALGYNIISSNACSEKPLPPYGVCCLASINMGKVPFINSANFHDFMKQYIPSMVRFMDNIVEYELENKHKSPLKEQYEIVKDLREIGLGVTNIHKWLYNQGLEYDSEEGTNALDEFFKWYLYYSFKSSTDLTLERGACPAWTKCKNSHTFKETKYLKHIFNEFPDLKERYYNIGLRNGALLSLAPTGSISMTFADDIISSGVESLIGYAYWRRTRAVRKGEWDYYFVIPNAVKNIVLNNIKDKDSEDYKLLESFQGSILDQDGSVGTKLIEIINKNIDINLLKPAHKIDPFKKVKMMGRIQKWIDSAISVTFNLPKEFSVENIKRLFEEAYKNKLKAITVYREGSREEILTFTPPKTNKQEVIIAEELKDRPEQIKYEYSPKRPKELTFEKFNVLKHKIIIGLFNDKPYECFILETSKKIPDNGYIVKTGKKQYSLFNEDKNIVIENMLADEVTNDEIKAITRLVSANLRHGVPIDFIVEQLSKCGDSISSYPKMLGRVLKKYKFLALEETISNEKCPQCNEPLIKYDGCSQCICGYSKCN